MSERVALYARVSTARQEQEQAIGSQLASLEQEAARRGWSIPAERRYIDDGFSGTRLDRPGLDALRDTAAKGLLDVVLIQAPDRLARSCIDQHVVLEELSRCGVRVHFKEGQQ
jgi:site-specific DNA recombinase